MRTAKEIRRYLKQQHWYKEYVRNAKSIRLKSYYLFHVRGYKGKSTISNAFFWDSSPQGHNIWNHRDVLFVNWYNRGKKRYENKKVSSQPARSPIGSSTD